MRSVEGAVGRLAAALDTLATEEVASRSEELVELHRYVHETGWHIKTTPDGHHEFIPPDHARQRGSGGARPPPTG
ncbi:MAG: hypothetical protein ACRDN9_20130 [Streptosporangiaceae bacterium]